MNSTGSDSLPEFGDDSAGLRMRQDRANHRRQIAAHAGAVVVEDRRNRGDVRGARVRRHQLQDQLPADERADVRVIEEHVERLIEILLRRLAGSEGLPRNIFAPVSW